MKTTIDIGKYKCSGRSIHLSPSTQTEWIAIDDLFEVIGMSSSMALIIWNGKRRWVKHACFMASEIKPFVEIASSTIGESNQPLIPGWKELISDACQAEEMFTLDELENHANSMRNLKANKGAFQAGGMKP